MASVHVSPHIKLASFDVMCPSTKASVSIRTASDGGTSYILDITPVSSLGSGMNEFDITLLCKDASGKQLPPIVLPVRASVQSSVSADPSAMVLGIVKIGETVEETLSLHSLDGDRLDVQQVAVADPQVDVRIDEREGACPRIAIIVRTSTPAKACHPSPSGELGRVVRTSTY